MERIIFFCYNMGHETPWIPRGTGKAPSTCHCFSERRQDHSIGRGAYGGSVEELRLSMVPRLPKGRGQGPSLKGNSRTSSQVITNREKGIGAAPFVRSAGRRVSDRPLDVETDCPNDSQALWHPVSSKSRMADTSGDAMELPETGAPGFTKERERNCALEGLPMAPYKKKPKNLGPLWSSLMNRVSCSFQTSVAPGPQKGKPRFSTTSTNRIGFPPSMLCRCRQNGNAWRFISVTGGGILTVWMFVLSLEGCSNNSGDPSSCCGIGERSTAVKKSNSFSWNIPGCIWNIFRPMPLN